MSTYLYITTHSKISKQGVFSCFLKFYFAVLWKSCTFEVNRMRRPNITETIKKGLDALPLDIEVWLYGSEARGDARPDSDIDLLVLFNKPKVEDEDRGKIYDITMPIEWDCGVAINPIIFPKTQWESRMTHSD